MDSQCYICNKKLTPFSYKVINIELKEEDVASFELCFDCAFKTFWKLDNYMSTLQK